MNLFIFQIFYKKMTSNTASTSTVKKVSTETQTVNPLEALLKTNNIFLFIPNIIGKKNK